MAGAVSKNLSSGVRDDFDVFIAPLCVLKKVPILFRPLDYCNYPIARRITHIYTVEDQGCIIKVDAKQKYVKRLLMRICFLQFSELFI